MACILNFDPSMMSPIPECNHKPMPWKIQGVVSWVSPSFSSFDIEANQNIRGIKKENHRFEVHGVTLPDFVSVGNTVGVSVDGENTRIELVKNGVKTA